jgi:hypothetical protein
VTVRLLILLAGVVAIVWSVKRWRYALQAAMVLVILEGAIRKWLVPGAQDLVYFAKDVVLLGAYVGYFRQRALLRYRPPALPLLWGALGFAALLGLLQVFNPNLPNLLVGILGFKAYFFYVPLILLIPAAFRTDIEIGTALRRYNLLAIPVGLLAVAQFLSPSSSPLNTYARPGPEAVAYVATFGSSEHVRVTSTFSFISGYTAYLLTITIFLLVWLGATRWHLRGNLLVYGAFGITLLGMLMTGSRGPVVLLLVLLPFYWWLGVLREKGGGGTLGRLVLGSTLVLALIGWLGQDALEAFAGRARGGSGEVSSRITTPLQAPFFIINEAGLIGFGIGSTHQTAAAVTPGIPPYAWLRGLMIEAETGRVMLELGAIGFTVFYLIRIGLVLFAFSQVFRLRTRFHRILAVGSFLYLLASLPGSIVFDLTSGIYYWTFVGILFLAMRLDEDAVRAARTRTAAATPAPAGGPEPGPVPVPQARTG